MAIQIWVKTLTRRKTRVNDPLPTQPGLGGNFASGVYSPPTGVSGQGSANYGGYTASLAGQSVGGLTNNIALINLDDGPTRRIFSNKSTTVVPLPDVVADFQISGQAAAAGTASGLVWRAPRNCMIYGVVVQAGSVSAGAGSVTFDVQSVSTPTAAGTSIFVDSTRLPALSSTQDYSPYLNASYPYMGQPGGTAIMASASITTTAPFGVSQVGQGASGNSNVFLGSAVGLGTCTPNNMFAIPAGTYLRIQVGAAGTVSAYGSNYTIQLFGF